MSISWWAEAAHASNYIYNHFPHRALGCTPFELWYGHKPNLANLRVWGCLAYVHLQKDQREEPKHGAHTRLCTFIAYHDDYKGWEFLNHETGSRVVSSDVLWQENAFRHEPWIPWPEQHPMLQPPAAHNAPVIKGHGKDPNFSKLTEEFNVSCSTLGHCFNGCTSK